MSLRASVSPSRFTLGRLTVNGAQFVKAATTKKHFPLDEKCF